MVWAAGFMVGFLSALHFPAKNKSFLKKLSTWLNRFRAIVSETKGGKGQER
jgi:hypothetical protein